MYQMNRIYIKKNLRLVDLIIANPVLLQVMEFFGMNNTIGDKTVEQVCGEEEMNVDTFIIISNLYSGFYPDRTDILKLSGDIPVIVAYLQKSHQFYMEDKYPEIKNLIAQLYKHNNHAQIEILENFINDYFKEVFEHFEYENKIVFPSFIRLATQGDASGDLGNSSGIYQEHHSDIETKLADFRNLLLKHIPIDNAQSLKRKILNCLFDFEFDLNVHSKIEEIILMPLISELESHE